jgi:hypothetical protein
MSGIFYEVLMCTNVHKSVNLCFEKTRKNRFLLFLDVFLMIFRPELVKTISYLPHYKHIRVFRPNWPLKITCIFWHIFDLFLDLFLDVFLTTFWPDLPQTISYLPHYKHIHVSAQIDLLKCTSSFRVNFRPIFGHFFMFLRP